MITAVNDVSFEVRAGEFFGLLGPNGAGKTTLFKMLGTWIIPDGGTALIDGQDVLRDSQAVRRLVGNVTSNERSLFWRLSAIENLQVHAGLYGISRGGARRRIQEVLEAVELTDTGERMVGSFSSGMKQRLLIARALLPRPKVLLLDEPTRSLDPLSARSFRRLLRSEVAGHQGCAVLLATHSSEEAMELCDRVAVLDRGELLAIGTADELKSKYGDERYRVRTDNPGHRVFARLQEDGLIRDRQIETEAEGWVSVEIVIPGGTQSACNVLEALTSASVRVAEFARIDMSLADLIDHIVHPKSGDGR